MAGITWLHLSDWHQRGAEFNRTVVRDKLLEDLRDREKIDSDLAQIHFVVFSGDLAFSGKGDEYEAVGKELLDPVLEAVGLEPERLFVVPGNHDLDRLWVDKMLPSALTRQMESEEVVHEWLTVPEQRNRVLEPFQEYAKFVSGYNGQANPAFASIHRLEVDGQDIALLGLNSAWMCGRNKEGQGDLGFALIGEAQIHGALEQIRSAHVRLVVMHHSFEWLARFDRNRVEQRLAQAAHFILHGHEHQPEVKKVSGPPGAEYVLIPAGTAFNHRIPSDPRYTNAYNLVHLNVNAGQGVAYLRRWSEENTEWRADTTRHEKPPGRCEFRLPKELGHRHAQPGPVDRQASKRGVKRRRRLATVRCCWKPATSSTLRTCQ